MKCFQELCLQAVCCDFSDGCQILLQMQYVSCLCAVKQQRVQQVQYQFPVQLLLCFCLQREVCFELNFNTDGGWNLTSHVRFQFGFKSWLLIRNTIPPWSDLRWWYVDTVCWHCIFYMQNVFMTSINPVRLINVGNFILNFYMLQLNMSWVSISRRDQFCDLEHGCKMSSLKVSSGFILTNVETLSWTVVSDLADTSTLHTLLVVTVNPSSSNLKFSLFFASKTVKISTFSSGNSCFQTNWQHIICVIVFQNAIAGTCRTQISQSSNYKSQWFASFLWNVVVQVLDGNFLSLSGSAVSCKTV